MPKAPDISLIDSPVGPLRDKYLVIIGAADFELPTGFICQIASTVASQDITYRTLAGTSDQVENDVAQGSIISVGVHPVLLSAVRGSSTVTEIIVGRL